eukprot:Hpha_TRINITY_DN16795_c1_g4::TRINITY_DN16795_c1_g4_i2::g.78223::m.78223/K07953/SAR1; GTP-binding protein SAR1
MSGLMLFVCVPPECAAPGAAGQVPVEVEPMATANDVVEQLRRTGTVRGEVDLRWQGRRLALSDILADVGLCPQSTICVAPSRRRLRSDGGGGSGSTGWSDWVWGGLGYLPSALGLYKPEKPEFNLLVLGLSNAGKTFFTFSVHNWQRTDDHRAVRRKRVLNRVEIGGNILVTAVFTLGSIGSVGGRGRWVDGNQALSMKVDGVVFFVDAADQQRFPEAKAELDRLLVDERLANVPFCVLGNKDDHPSACSEAELQVALGLQGITTGKDVSETNRSYVPLEIFMCSLWTLDALRCLPEWMRWLLSNMDGAQL